MRGVTSPRRGYGLPQVYGLHSVGVSVAGAVESAVAVGMSGGVSGW